MANLSKEQALKLIKEPQNQREINRARTKRVRHKLHTEPETESLTFGDSHTRFLSWVKGLLVAEDNFQRFSQLYRPPLITNELTEAIFSEFEKVFEAKNAFERFEFTDSELENDFSEYRKRIGDFNFWETQGFETFKNSIDNILVVDLPALQQDANGNFIQTSERPEPYYFLLDIDNLIDIDNKKIEGRNAVSGKQFYYFRTEYIIFHGENNTIFVFDDTYYRRYSKGDGSVDPILDFEVAHNLGFTPARSFWTTPLNSTSKIQKRSPITNSISELDWYLFFSISQKYLELYAPYPIYAIYKSKCNFKEITGAKRQCVDGFLQGNGEFFAGAERQKCPQCASKIRVGPGNVMLIDVPKEKSDDFDLMANPMKVIPAETTSLNYVKQAVLDKRNEIFSNCVGRGKDAENDQAVNELQIKSGFESRGSVLIKIKRNFEIIHAFALDTIARLRYGSSFLSLTIDYGDEFFVKDESEEIAEYKEAVANGLPAYELATRRQAIYETRYKNNPDLLERLKIMRNLEPFPDNNIAQLQEIRSKTPELVPLKRMIIKINFNSFIDRFEREQANILLFASAITFDLKILTIQKVLEGYADEVIAEGAPIAPTPGSFSVGQPVTVIPGKEHMLEHKGMKMVIAEVNGDTYAVKLPDGTIHKWYTSAELQGQAPTPPMNM